MGMEILTVSEEIITTVADEKVEAIIDELERQFHTKCGAIRRFSDGLTVTAYSDTGSAFSIGSNFSAIAIRENQSRTGYVIKCETIVKPAKEFYFFCLLGVIFLPTIIGSLMIFHATFSNYDQYKNMVVDGMKIEIYGVKEMCEIRLNQDQTSHRWRKTNARRF